MTRSCRRDTNLLRVALDDKAVRLEELMEFFECLEWKKTIPL